MEDESVLPEANSSSSEKSDQPLTIQHIVDILIRYDVIFYGGVVRGLFDKRGPKDIDVIVTKSVCDDIVSEISKLFRVTLGYSDSRFVNDGSITIRGSTGSKIKVDLNVVPNIDTAVPACSVDFDINVLRLRKLRTDEDLPTNSVEAVFYGHRCTVYADGCFPITTVIQRIRDRQMVYLQCETAKKFYPTFNTECWPWNGSGDFRYRRLRRRIDQFESYGFTLLNKGMCQKTYDRQPRYRITPGNCNMWDWESLERQR